jgi:hypothetical protein
MSADTYLRAVAVSVGVPEIWLEDCEQEMRIAMWQAGNDSRLVARRTAIDFVRVYGRRSRSGQSRDYSYISGFERETMNGFEATSDRGIDFASAFESLTRKQQQAVIRNALGYPVTRTADYGHCEIARQKLRKAC